jgi:hypothetical protein
MRSLEVGRSAAGWKRTVSSSAWWHSMMCLGPQVDRSGRHVDRGDDWILPKIGCAM